MVASGTVSRVGVHRFKRPPERPSRHKRYFEDAPRLEQRCSPVLLRGFPADELFTNPRNQTSYKFGDYVDWLEGCRGTVVEKFEWAYLGRESERFWGLLGAFERVGVTTWVPTALLISDSAVWKSARAMSGLEKV